MKKLLYVLLIGVLLSCSKDDEEKPIEQSFYKIKLEIISSNQFNSFEYYYSIGDNKGYYLSSGEKIFNQPKWETTITIPAPPIKNIQLGAFVGWEHTTTFNIYVNGELKKTGTFTGESIKQHEISYQLE